MMENVQSLVKYRLEQADESLKAANVLLNERLFRPSVNRSYYAMFYAVLALLAVKKVETSKHSGAISIFDRDFIKPNTFPREYSQWLHEAFNLRQRSDYSGEYTVSDEEAETALERARFFVEKLKAQLIPENS